MAKLCDTYWERFFEIVQEALDLGYKGVQLRLDLTERERVLAARKPL